MRLKIVMTAALLAFSPLLVTAQAAAEPPVYTSALSNVALQGYDATAYFKLGTPTKGSKDFTATYQGATFQFASKANRDAFAANPAKYAPQYGGYCAWAVSQGYHAKGDARNWRIVDGKLYLNYNAKVQADWERDAAGFIAKAETQWPLINK
jgi:YHS domain-containing protein